MMNRKAVTLVEMLVVIAIIGLLLAMFFPAINSVRERAQETVCKNNVRQFGLAFTMYFQARKKLPPTSRPRYAEGWTIELLPFMEQANKRKAFSSNSLLVNIDEEEAKQPPTFRCPTRSASEDSLPGIIPPAHYVIMTNQERKICIIGDAPLDLVEPWLNSPELFSRQKGRPGPHQGGYYIGGSRQNHVNFSESF